jgi:predicted ATPase
LHPAGQAKIAEMYAIAANNGVQIIVETHSDHFLNGVRVATKNKVIAPDKSQIYFFEKQKDSLDAVLRPINIDKDGKLSDWPKSFFDEWDNQLDKLLW